MLRFFFQHDLASLFSGKHLNKEFLCYHFVRYLGKGVCIGILN